MRSGQNVVIVNPAAGGGRAGALWPEVEALVMRALGGCQVRLTSAPGDATVMARDAALHGAELVVAAGGDGTLSEVARGVLMAGAGERVRLGLIHLGTGGDFRRSLGLPERLDQVLGAIQRGGSRPVDVGVARFFDKDGAQAERPFVNVASAGMGGLVDSLVHELPSLGGKAAYFVASLKALARSPATRVRCNVDDTSTSFSTRQLSICNGCYFGGGMHIAPMALVDDGRLEVVALTGEGRLPLLRLIPEIYRGTHLGFTNVWHAPARRFELETFGEAMPIDLDGEHVGTTPLTVEVKPGALRVVA